MSLVNRQNNCESCLLLGAILRQKLLISICCVTFQNEIQKSRPPGKVNSPNLGDIVIQKLNIACHCSHLPKGFDIEKKSKPQIRSVYYHLKCSMEARFSKTTSTGRKRF